MTTPSRGKILVVDDEESVRRLLNRFLTSHGYQVLEAADGEMGREMAVVNLPDLILTDLRMPILDGVAMTRALRTHAALNVTPILVVSALDDHSNVISALEAGANDYVSKPLVFEVLRARIESQLRTKQLHDELRRQHRESELLFGILHEATESVDLDEILFRITDRLGGMMMASRCSVVSVDSARKVGTILASMEDRAARGLDLDLERYPEVIQAIRSLDPVLVDDSSNPELRAELAAVFRSKQVASILTVPLVYRGRPLGVLQLHVRNGEPPLTDRQVKFVRMVALAVGGMVRNIHRFESLRAAAGTRAITSRVPATA